MTMSFLDFLTTGSNTANGSTGSSTSTSLPSWYMNYLQPTINNAAQVAAQPYPDYGATGMPRIAAFTNPQIQSQQMVQANTGDYQPYMGAAATTAANASGPYDPNQMNQFLSPYLSGVTGAIQNQASNMWNETIAPTINDAFTQNGQAGSTRQGDVLSHAARDVQSGVANQSAIADQNAYSAANQNYLNWQQQGLNAAGRLGSLGQLQQQLDTQGAAGLDTIGQQQQNLNQQNLNLSYQDFMNQANWPQQQVSFMSNILNGVPNPGMNTNSSGTQSQTSTSQTSPLGTLAGAFTAATALGRLLGP